MRGFTEAKNKLLQIAQLINSLQFSHHILYIIMNAASDNDDKDMGNNSFNNADAEYEDLDENDKLETR